MLTPEQLEYLRGMRFEESCSGLSVGSDAIVAHIDAQQARIAELEQDAARYRWLRDKMLGVDFDWNESGLTALCFEMPDGCAYGGNCDQNIDNAMQSTWPEDASDYASRIAVIGQNGNDGLHYPEETP